MLVYIVLWLGWGFFNQTNRITGLARSIYFLILMGLPPFVMFFLKVLL
jgi:formate hydrogenlyase subunit 3/multisubunit Na+/H+ antiporter MnhD subunit